MSHKVLGEVVQASALGLPEPSATELWYHCLPVGEESAVMASGHQFSVPAAGLVTLPADPRSAHVNQEHDRTQVVGQFSQFKETPKGIYGLVDFAPTSTGKDALVLASRGLRKGISVELTDVVIRAGKLLKGTLAHAAVTVNPSFGSATVMASAADVGEVTADLQDAAKLLNDAIAALLDEEPDDDDQNPPADPDEKKDPAPMPTEVKAARKAQTDALQTVLASLGSGTGTGQAAPVESPLTVLAKAQASLAGTSSNEVKAAALDQITQNDVFDVVNAPAYAGELWKGRKYAGRYLDLLLAAPMVSQTVQGWRWIKGKTPQVALWSPPSSGSPQTMNDIHSTEVKAESVTHKGFRIAGGQAVDRIHVDMPSAEWWSSYNGEATDDYARKLDGLVIAHITDPENVTAIELVGTLTTEERILEAIGAVIEFADPDYILLGWDLFVEMALGKKFDQSIAQASGGDATITLSAGHMGTSYLTIPVKAAPRSQVDQYGRILVGCKAANELQSLPGGPVRVEAQTITKGLIEHGVFGYHILRDIDARGVVEATATVPAAAV